MEQQIDGNRIAVVYSSKNVKGKSDASGAFIPEAERFAAVHGVPSSNMFGIDCPGVSKAARRKKLYDAMLDMSEQPGGSMEALVFFCHGWPQGVQFGLDLKNCSSFVSYISHFADENLKVILYACLAAENDERELEIRNIGPGTDGGFADVFRDAMVAYGMKAGRVDAHKTAGHTTRNPYVVRFHCAAADNLTFNGVGGEWLISPASVYWKRWVAALKNVQNFRYQFPFMDELDIKAALVSK